MADQPNEWQQALAAIDLSAIESLKKLKTEQDQLDERLKSMDELKANFAPPVFERVRSDYHEATERSRRTGRAAEAGRARTVFKSARSSSNVSKPITKR